MSIYTRGISKMLRHGYIQLYEYLYLGILTIIRVVIHSWNLFDTNNYLSIYTWVYSHLYK